MSRLERIEQDAISPEAAAGGRRFATDYIIAMGVGRGAGWKFEKAPKASGAGTDLHDKRVDDMSRTKAMAAVDLEPALCERIPPSELLRAFVCEDTALTELAGAAELPMSGGSSGRW